MCSPLLNTREDTFMLLSCGGCFQCLCVSGGCLSWHTWIKTPDFYQHMLTYEKRFPTTCRWLGRTYTDMYYLLQLTVCPLSQASPLFHHSSLSSVLSSIMFVIWTRMRLWALQQKQQTTGVKSARTIDVTHTTGTQQQRPESPTITPPHLRRKSPFMRMSPLWSLLYVLCINRMPSGVITGDSGLCCYICLLYVWRQLFKRC